MADSEQRDLTSFGATRAAAMMAYEDAGIGAEDIDVIELHDAFTTGELLHYEGLGLCAKGAGEQLVRDGATTIGGRVPVNVSGGLLAKSHPLGATGVAQFCELAWQLRRRGARATGRECENGPRSQPGGYRGSTPGATCVTILARG